MLLNYPLEYFGEVKELIREVRDPLKKEILAVLDKTNMSKKEILDACKDHMKDEVDYAMRKLRAENLIFYDRAQNLWCLNREFIRYKYSISRHDHK